MSFSDVLWQRLSNTLGDQGAAQEILGAIQTLVNVIGVPVTNAVVLPGNFAVLGAVLVDASVAAIAAAGSTNANGAALTGACNVVTGADGTKGVVLPSPAVVGQKVTVINTNLSNALNVYSDPSGTGGKVNGGSANAADSLAAGKAATYICTSITGANSWWAISR